jgi:hypothetical protein
MRISETDPKLTLVCRELEQRLADVPRLSTLEVPVRLLATFRDLPEAKRLVTFAKTPAAFRQSTKTICVNDELFFAYANRVRLAILVHEVAHAFRYLNGLIPQQHEEIIHECMWADRLVCEWGFCDELIEERRQSYGKEYVAALEKWPKEAAFVSAMAKYRQLKLAGLVRA